MEDFKKELLGLCRNGRTATMGILAVALVFLVLGLTTHELDYGKFNGFKSGYQKMDAVYLLGPFSGEKEEDGTVYEYYVAEDADGYLNIVKTAEEHEFPIYGLDVFDADLEDEENLATTRLYGYSKKLPNDVAEDLIEVFSNDEWNITQSNYSEYFGKFYLDTTDTTSTGEVTMLFKGVACLMVFFGLIAFWAGGIQKRSTKRQLKKMEKDGTLDPIYDDFAANKKFVHKGPTMAVSEKYLLDFSVVRGFDVISLENVVNVFKCNMVDGNPTAKTYIALEDKDGERKLIGAAQDKPKGYEDAAAQLKEVIQGGRV